MVTLQLAKEFTGYFCFPFRSNISLDTCFLFSFSTGTSQKSDTVKYFSFTWYGGHDLKKRKEKVE